MLDSLRSDAGLLVCSFPYNRINASTEEGGVSGKRCIYFQFFHLFLLILSSPACTLSPSAYPLFLPDTYDILSSHHGLLVLVA